MTHHGLELIHIEVGENLGFQELFIKDVFMEGRCAKKLKYGDLCRGLS